MHTIWQPDLSRRRGPAAAALAEAIAEAVQTGQLKPGDRLPPQRDLADRLGINVTTVTRGYAEATRRGLVTGEVGRGTYVRPPAFGAVRRADEPDAIDLTINTLLPVAHANELVTRFGAITGRLPAERLLGYQPPQGRRELREAGAAWLTRAGLDVPAEEIVVTMGAQHALTVALSVLCAPGDEILTERLTYSGIKAIANLLHVSVRPVDIDEQGLKPESLEAVGSRSRSRVLYCMPSVQNPTGAVASLRRRREIAAVAERLRLTIVEDDSYGFLVDRLPTLASILPDQTIYVTGLSKSVVPGLRTGFLRAPRRWIDRLAAGVFATSVMVAPASAEVAATWIADGTADRIARWKRTEIAARIQLARRRLKALRPRISSISPHLWLRLPDTWTADEYAREAELNGVLLTPGREFAADRSAPNAVRICLGAPPQRQTLDEALKVLAKLAQERGTRFSAIV